MQYIIVFEQTEHNWSAYVPDLPGCIATGATRQEVEARMTKGIKLHIEMLKELGEPVPQPGAWTGSVTISPSRVGAAHT